MKARSHATAIWFLLATWGIYFYFVFRNMLYRDSTGLYSGHPYVWSDWPLHMAMAHTFAFKSPSQWFLHHPVFGAGKLNYPFLTNFLSGMLVRLGFTIESAFNLPSILFAITLTLGLYFLFELIFQSRRKAILTICLFYFSAGLGFVYFFKALFSTGDFGQLTFPLREYSRFEEYGWGSGNVWVGLLVPQRAFLLGMNLGVWSMYCFFKALMGRASSDLKSKQLMLTGGLLASLLPITHMHTLIAMTLMVGVPGLASWRKLKLQLYYVLPLLLVGGAIYYLYLFGAVNTSGFFKWYPGWSAKSVFGWMEQWAWQWGFTLPVAIAGYVWIWKKTDVLCRSFFAAFFLLFIVSNLILFQPTVWDNSKIFLWSYLGLSALCAWTLAELYSRENLFKSAAIVLFLLLSLTGITEMIRLPQVEKNRNQIMSQEDIELSEKIRALTDPTAMFVTAPSHRHPIAVWAPRPVVLGYEGWAINFGFPASEARRNIETIYRGGETALELIKKLNISYVDVELNQVRENHIDLQFFQSHFPVTLKNSTHVIFEVKGR